MHINKGFKSEIIKQTFRLRHLLIYTYYTSQKSAIQICKPHYLSRLAHFLYGCSSVCSGSVSITEVSFSFRFSSMLRTFSHSVFPFSSSSKAKVSVVKFQRLNNEICFLPSGNNLGNELGYPLVTESGFFLLVGLFFFHNGLDNLGSELAVLVILLHFDSLCQ